MRLGSLVGVRAARVLLTVAAVGTAASIAGLGTYATFTSSTSVSHSATSGTVTIALGATGAATNRLNVSATGVVPGDTMQRSVDLINTGNQNLASITLTTSATTSSLLDTDATNGLKMTIEKCSIPWVEAGSSPAFTYTCAGTTSTVLAQRAVVGTDLALSNLGSTTSGSTDYLRVKLELPSGAGNTFQGLTSTIQYAFTGTQRAATNK